MGALGLRTPLSQGRSGVGRDPATQCGRGTHAASRPQWAGCAPAGEPRFNTLCPAPRAEPLLFSKADDPVDACEAGREPRGACRFEAELKLGRAAGAAALPAPQTPPAPPGVSARAERPVSNAGDRSRARSPRCAARDSALLRSAFPVLPRPTRLDTPVSFLGLWDRSATNQMA